MRPKGDQVKAKDHDVFLAERTARVQLASFRLQQVLDLPEVRNLPEPAVPFQMPRPKGLELGVGLGFSDQPDEKYGLSFAEYEIDSDFSSQVGVDDHESELTSGEDDDQDPKELLWRPPPGYIAEVEEYEGKSPSEDEDEDNSDAHEFDIVPQAKGRRRSNSTPYQDRKRTKLVVDLVSPSAEQAIKRSVRQPIKQQRHRPHGLNLDSNHGVPSIEITGASPQPSHPSTTTQVPNSSLPVQLPSYSTSSNGLNPQMDSSHKHAADTNTTFNPFQVGTNRESVQMPRRASPPPPYLSPRLHVAHLTMPAYWSSSLSRLIYTWLLQNETRATQTEVADIVLAHVQSNPMAQYYTGLHTPPSSPLILNRLDGRWQANLKVTRLILPSTADVTFDQSHERDWFVIQSTDRVPGDLPTITENTMRAKTKPGLAVTTTYWVLAFPTRSVRSVNTDQIFTGNGIIHRTCLMVGCQRSFPLFHGRTVRNPYLLDGFMNAFIQGEGMIQTMSSQPLPLNF